MVFPKDSLRKSLMMVRFICDRSGWLINFVPFAIKELPKIKSMYSFETTVAKDNLAIALDCRGLHCQQDSAQDHVDYCGKKASHPVRASL
jgi:hypothetical protein